MANIYEDVEALQLAVAALQTKEIAENTDLNGLTAGNYYIPSAEVSATILNKPTTRTATANITVMQAGNDGQLIMIYRICDKTTATYYQRVYYTSGWGAWLEVGLTDSGWLDLPLATGITAYSDAQKPRYRKIGNTVFLNGVYKGAVGENVTVATLPTGYRPAKKAILATASVGQMFSKISIETNGEIVLNRTTVEPIVAENWHSIACCFEVD
jgi:hypothetical protein